MTNTEFRLIIDEPSSGAWNMAADEVLLAWAGRTGGCCLRFYEWTPGTLSLGYFQQAAERAGHAASLASPLVRRASGGGAIMHDRELTYSIAVPHASRWGRERLALYDVAHDTLCELLAAHGVKAERWVADVPNAGANAIVGCGQGDLLAGCSQGDALAGCGAHDAKSFLCFERRTPGDVIMHDTEGRHWKIGGSAQRRSSDALLQHGSVLLDRSAAAPELPGVNDLSSIALDVETLRSEWLGRLADALGATWRNEPFTDEERLAAERLIESKYANDAWTVDKQRPADSAC